MGRTVTAVMTHNGACAGTVGPFPVEIPWWAQAEPVVAHLEETLGVPVVVLRLLAVEGSDGARDGHVTYHVEALEPPGELAQVLGPAAPVLARLLPELLPGAGTRRPGEEVQKAQLLEHVLGAGQGDGAA